MSDPNAQPIAGWYPDPENEAGDRWWNGATWSDHRRARNAGPGWAPTAAPADSKAAAKGAAPAAGAAPGIPVPPVAPAPAERPNPYAGTALPGTAMSGTAMPGTPAPGAPNMGPMMQPYAPPYAYNYAPRTPMANVPAFAGMITSLAALLFNWILFGLPGLVGGSISIYGLVKANQLVKSGVTTGNGRGYALIGIISGFAGALLFDLFYFAVFQPLSFS